MEVGTEKCLLSRVGSNLIAYDRGGLRPPPLRGMRGGPGMRGGLVVVW